MSQRDLRKMKTINDQEEGFDEKKIEASVPNVNGKICRV